MKVFGLLILAASYCFAQSGSITDMIANGIKPPQVETMTEAAGRVERLKAIQLENQRRQLENEQLRRTLATPPSPQPKVQTARQPEPAQPQNIAELQTDHLFNGRAWNQLNEASKTTYLYAVLEGLAAEAPAKLPDYFGSPLTFDELRVSVDRLYAAPENLLIPIIFGFKLVNLRAAGASPSEFEERLASLRKYASAAHVTK